MKKTLVALAALAATSAFAAPTITGEYAFGYEATSLNGVDAAGFGVDTSTVTFADSEDLGGGVTVAASINIDTIARNGVSGGDTKISLAGGFGKVEGGLVKGADYLSGVVGGIAGFDGKVFGARTYNDYVTYTLPAFGAVSVALTHQEAQSGTGLAAGGTGDGSVTGQRSDTVSVSYASGALAANLGYTQWDSYGASTGANDNGKSRVRVKGSYNFGVGTVGAGAVAKTLVDGTYNEQIVAASFPIGALTLGVDFASSKKSINGGADTNKNGYGIQVGYALSKRTTLSANYRNWDDTSAKRNTDTWAALDFTF